MKKNFFIIAWFLSITILAQNANRKFVKASVTADNVLVVNVNDGHYNIQFYNDEIIETSFIPKNQKENIKSHAVVLQPNILETEFNDNGNSIQFSSKGIKVEIQKKPFKLSYYHNNKYIISERKGYHTLENSEAIELNIASQELLYGGGARALGMNRRGNRLQLYNRAHYGYETRSELMNYTLPIVISSNKYMVHFDNAPIGYLDLDSKKDNTLTYETISGRKTYQVIVGNTWYDLIDNYTDLTGKQPMIPRWSLGNFSSRFGYHSEKEARNTIQKFKDANIPVDAIILDLYWFGKTIKGTMGNLKVNKDSFPNMKQMISDFKKEGVKTILITEPFVLTTSKRWKEAVNNDVLAKDSIGNPYTFDFYFGNTGLIDIYNPKGKKWFWNIYKELKSLGATGAWGDLGEPEVHPSKLIHASGTADEVHNIYGHDWAKLIFEGYKKEYADERPFILMRAGYSGSQRYGLIPWSGDVNRTWGGLQSQQEIALQMGMQGLGYMHSDLGGFAGANLDDELYTRWLQYGVFQPIFRPHAQEEVPSEPVFRSPKTKALAKEAIELRYKMLPYNYNLVFENNQKGTPLMRPLFFEDNTPNLLETSNTYLWGNDFLIHPIVNSEIKKQTIYFPKNSHWFDFYTNEIITGGKSSVIKVHENYIPTYTRAGAFIAMTEDKLEHTGMYNLNKFDLHYYHHLSVKKSKRQLYNDDGKTANAYEKGNYELLKFEAEVSEKCVEIQLKTTLGNTYSFQEKEMNLIIHNITKTPKKVKINSKKTTRFTWGKENRIIRIPILWNTKKDTKITIKL